VRRIGAYRSLTLKACEAAVRAPFDDRMTALLDLLYSDRGQAGVTGVTHAQILLRRWLKLSVLYEGGDLAPFFEALIAVYPEPVIAMPPVEDPLGRRAAEHAMRAPFDELVRAYLVRVFDPERPSGIRDASHARATFITFCNLLQKYREAPC